MDPFAADVARTIAAWKMFTRADRVLLAVSGGADSVALLAALLECEQPLAVGHFNHRWRGAESERDENFVRQLCGGLGVEAFFGHADAARETPRGNLEQQARVARYDFLARTAAAVACTCVATAHTRDDQAETVLLRLMRGSGVSGLRGILPVRSDRVVRPLLDVGRDDVLAYLARRGLPHVEDSSNLDVRFARNRVRRDLLPLLRQYEPRIAKHLAQAARSLFFVERRQRSVARELVAAAVDAAGRLDLARLADHSPSLRSLAVRAWLRRERGTLRRITAAHVAAVAACSRSGAQAQIPGGGSVVNEHGLLRFTAGLSGPDIVLRAADLQAGETVAFGAGWRIQASPIAEARSTPALPSDLWEAVFDADHTGGSFAVRRWRAGDRVQPLGMRGHRKLSDVFIDAKVSRWQRTRWPIVDGPAGIVWVPGLVRGSGGLVDASTRRVVRLRATQSSQERDES